MLEDIPTSLGELAKQIRSFAGDLQALRHFEFSVDSSRVLSDIKSLCTFSITTPTDFLLPCIRKNELSIYDIRTSAKTIYKLPIAFSFGYQLAFIDRNALIVVGSDPASNVAFLIKLTRVDAMETRKMKAPRNLPGLIVVEDIAYVFGGHCNSCEKYQISADTWMALPDMKRSKTGFSPCLHSSEIFLYDCISNFDVFDIRSETFRKIIVTGLLSHDYLIAIFDRNELCILIQNNQFGCWPIGSSTITMTRLESYRDGDAPVSQCKPILVGREVYYVSRYSGNVVAFNLDTKTFTRKWE